jgi:putative aldouronate transport system permease protein
MMEKTKKLVPRYGSAVKTKTSHRSALQDWQLYLMACPAMVLLFLFAYMPLGGLVIAFKNYDFEKGIFGSPWMDPFYKNFEILFHNNPAAFTAIRNTLLLNALFISVGTIFALVLSLALNEITGRTFKKFAQSVTFLPYFISTVVVGVFVAGLFNYDTGTVNHLLQLVGLPKVQFYMEAGYWPWIMLLVNIWKGAGYTAVVYLATISGFDPSYYEAAQIDGASRWQQIWYISLPLLKPTVIIMTLMSVGRIMNADFGLFYNVTGDMPSLYSTTDVIDTFIFRTLRQTGDIGISSATGFFQSIVSFILVLICNKAANKIEEGSALF